MPPALGQRRGLLAFLRHLMSLAAAARVLTVALDWFR